MLIDTNHETPIADTGRPITQSQQKHHLPMCGFVTLANHSRAEATTVPTINFRVEHTSTALGAVVPETINGTTKESRWRAGASASGVSVRAHCNGLLCGKWCWLFGR
jgi:hypothetical protein